MSDTCRADGVHFSGYARRLRETQNEKMNGPELKMGRNGNGPTAPIRELNMQNGKE